MHHQKYDRWTPEVPPPPPHPHYAPGSFTPLMPPPGSVRTEHESGDNFYSSTESRPPPPPPPPPPSVPMQSHPGNYPSDNYPTQSYNTKSTHHVYDQLIAPPMEPLDLDNTSKHHHHHHQQQSSLSKISIPRDKPSMPDYNSSYPYAHVPPPPPPPRPKHPPPGTIRSCLVNPTSLVCSNIF